MRIDVWSDYLCPFCYLGGQRLNKALENLNIKAEIYHHAFELNPTDTKLPIIEMMTKRFGMNYEDAIKNAINTAKVFEKEGLNYNWKKMIYANTRKAHQLAKFGEVKGLGDQVHNSLLEGHFAKGYDLDDINSLIEIAKEVGLDPEESRKILEDQVFAKAVEGDLELVNKFGISGVPFYIFAEKYSISGALETQDFMKLIEEVQSLV